MIYVLSGFIFGLFIPYIARRFAKFMPATGAYAIYRVLKQNKKVSPSRRNSNRKYKSLMKVYVKRSIVWGFVIAAVSYVMLWLLGDNHIGWYLSFIWILMLLAEIDYKMHLLPDILTFPLLLLGFACAVMVGQWVGVGESVIGALFGYFMPIFASLLFVWKKSDAFGGGDIKLLSAVGAWLGLDKLLYVIIASSIIFIIWSLVKKKREGAYGPSVLVAVLFVIFYFFSF